MFSLILMSLLAAADAPAGSIAASAANPVKQVALNEELIKLNQTDVSAEEAADSEQPPAVIRVSGEQDPPVYERGAWRWEQSIIPTNLPVGYPAPTPPGAVEIKRYPSARRAEVSMTTSVGRASGTGFMPLFGHITRNEIAMTAPVEMEFSDADAERGEDVEWTMAFLYERPDQGELGVDERDGRVEVVQTEPITVLAMGAQGYVRGGRGMGDMEAKLEAWIAENPDWQRAGRTRWFGYNGPEIRPAFRWSEVQIPIEPVTAAD